MNDDNILDIRRTVHRWVYYRLSSVRDPIRSNFRGGAAAMTYSESELHNLKMNLYEHWDVIVAPEYHAWVEGIEKLIEQAQLAKWQVE